MEACGSCCALAQAKPDREVGHLTLGGQKAVLQSLCDFVRLTSLDALIDLFAVYSDAFGGVDTDPDLIAVDGHNGDGNVVADAQGFTGIAGKYEHDIRPDCALVPALRGRGVIDTAGHYEAS